MQREYLKQVECSEQALDIAFHPSRENILACALVDGSLEIHDAFVDADAHIDEDLDEDEDEDEPDSIIASFGIHINNGKVPDDGGDSSQQKKASCRSVAFSTDGSSMFTGGLHGDLCAIDAERACHFSTTNTVENCLRWRIDDSTGTTASPVQSLLPFSQSPLLASGDEAGGVRIWDLRLCGSSNSATTTTKKAKRTAATTTATASMPKGCVMSWNEHTDYISGFDLHPDEHTLLASSADGRLGVFDLRRQPTNNNNGDTKNNRNNNHKSNKASTFRLSDNQEDELLSVRIMKHNKKVICGTADGILAVWSYGTWGDISDRMPGHPTSIDALLKVDEDVVLTGSSDGLIRVVQIHPDKFLGVLGDGHGGFPIEKLDFNANRHLVASLSHSPVVRLWDARILGDEYDDDDDDENDGDDDAAAAAAEQGPILDADRKPKAAMTAAAAVPISASNNGHNHNSDDDWEDASDNDSDASSDDDSDDSDDDESNRKDARLKKRFKTDNEKFFEDM